MEQREIVTSATDIGYYMLKFGAEIFRVEQSIEFICYAYGMREVDVFAIPTSIVVTIADGTEFYTKSRRVKGYQTNLDKVEQLNSLSRYICREKPDYKTIMKMLHDILDSPQYGFIIQLLAYSLVSFSFTLFFEGNYKDAVAAAFIGGFVLLLIMLKQRIKANSFFINILCGIVITILAQRLAFWHLADHPDSIMIGVLMTLVPGIALANCMRDFIANDIVAGMSRLAEALLTASGVAIGVAVILLAFS